MELDKIIKKISFGKEVFNQEISPADILKKKFSYKKNSRQLFVLLPPRGGRLYYNFFSRRFLLKNGFSVLEYQFPRAILSTDWKLTRNHFNFIRKSINKEMEKLIIKYKFQKITIVGISLGSIIACISAGHNPLVDELILVLPGHCLAESMWMGISSQQIRREYEKQHISLKQLKTHWYTLSPENIITNLKSKKFSIFLSRADKVVPYYCGKKLLDKVKSMKYPLYFEINNHLGHYLTGIQFFLCPKRFLSKRVIKI